MGQGALGCGGRGEGDIGEVAAGGIAAEAGEVIRLEGDPARAVVVVDDTVVQALLHLHHQLPGVAAAGDVVAEVADVHRAHEVLVGDEGEGVQGGEGVLVVGGDLGGVVQLALVAAVERALGRGGQGEDDVLQRRAGLPLAGLVEQGPGQLHRRCPLGGDGQIGAGLLEGDHDLAPVGAAVGGGAGEGDGGRLTVEAGVGDEDHVGEVGAPLGGGRVVVQGGANAHAGILGGLPACIEGALGGGDAEPRHIGEAVAGHGLALLGDLLLNGGEFQRIRGAGAGGVVDGGLVGRHRHRNFHAVAVAAGLDGDADGGGILTDTLHGDFAPVRLRRHLDAELAVDHRGGERGVAGSGGIGGLGVSEVLHILALGELARGDGEGLVLLDGDAGLQLVAELDAADSDGDGALDVAVVRGDTDGSRTGALGNDGGAVPVGAADGLDIHHLLVVGGPGDAYAVISVFRLRGGGELEAVLVRLQLQLVAGLAGAVQADVAAQLQAGDGAGRGDVIAVPLLIAAVPAGGGQGGRGQGERHRQTQQQAQPAGHRFLHGDCSFTVVFIPFS